MKFTTEEENERNMNYKVIITPRKLCDAGMEALAAQADY